MDKISKIIGQEVPKGASDVVDIVGINLVNKFGKDKLNEVAKLNFKNTERILK